MALLEEGPLLIIIIVVILFFGATQIPKLARSLGRAKGEFNKAKSEFHAEAGAAERQAMAPADESQVRQTARGLGIDEQGKSVEEVKRLIHQKLA